MKAARIARQALLLVALAFVPAISQAVYFRDKVSWKTSIPPSESVTVAKARGWGDQAIWVDARPDEEFEKDHVPGAIPVNQERWDELLPQFLSAWTPEKQVVVYCSSQSCNVSRDVARRLRNLTNPPMPNIYVLEGGWEEWEKTK